MSIPPILTATPTVPPLILRATATDTLLASAPCRIVFLRINATTAGTVSLFDNTAASLTNVLGGAYRCELGTVEVPLPPGGIVLKNGLFATFATFAGTVEVGVVRN
jgi:hypothetical protein